MPGGTVGTSTTGSVGIGISSPGTKLDIAGGVHADYGLFSRDDTATGTPWQLQLRGKTDQNLQLLMGMNTDLKYGSIQAFWQSHGPRNLVLEPVAGRVGIGTISPAFKLDVAGDIHSANSLSAGPYGPTAPGRISASGAAAELSWLDRTATDWNDAERWVWFATGGWAYLWNNGQKPIQIQQGIGNAALVLNATGNVGIGTASPTEKLSVNGTIRAKEVLVEASPWPDDVFADAYDLPSLEETSRYIEAEGHLPGVPSASEVADRGVSLGAIQAMLLRKIEELTLHQIDQERRLEEQSRLLDAQGRRIEELEAENRNLRGSEGQ